MGFTRQEHWNSLPSGMNRVEGTKRASLDVGVSEKRTPLFLCLLERWLGGWARRQNVFSGPSFMLLKLVNVVIKKGSTLLPLLNPP